MVTIYLFITMVRIIYINETGTGNLRIYSNDVEIKSNGGTLNLTTDGAGLL